MKPPIDEPSADRKRLSMLNLTYVARDVYPDWSRRIESAKESVTVYAPYFDGRLKAILQRARISPVRITIVTALDDVNALLMHPAQLDVIKWALDRGMPVLSLDGLHAKILLTDDRYVTVGSQNFTRRGGMNKECTALPREAFEGTRLLAALVEWKGGAEAIPKELVATLMQVLKTFNRRHRGFTAEVKEKVDAARERIRQELTRRRWRRLAEESSVRLAQKIASATIKSVPYESLYVDRGGTLTKWIQRMPDGLEREFEFDRLFMYPVIVAESEAMGFARIAESRITYFRTSAEREITVGGSTLKVDIEFGHEGTRKQNVRIVVLHPFVGTCKIGLHFNGESLKLLSRRHKKAVDACPADFRRFKALLQRDLFASTESLRELFCECIKRFPGFKKLQRERKNVTDFLTGQRFYLNMIEYQAIPILVIGRA